MAPHRLPERLATPDETAVGVGRAPGAPAVAIRTGDARYPATAGVAAGRLAARFARSQGSNRASAYDVDDGPDPPTFTGVVCYRLGAGRPTTCRLTSPLLQPAPTANAWRGGIAR